MTTANRPTLPPALAWLLFLGGVVGAWVVLLDGLF